MYHVLFIQGMRGALQSLIQRDRNLEESARESHLSKLRQVVQYSENKNRLSTETSSSVFSMNLLIRLTALASVTIVAAMLFP